MALADQTGGGGQPQGSRPESGPPSGVRTRVRRAAASARSPVRLAVGIGLIGASFFVYPAYPVIALLPTSGGAKVAAAAAVSVLSWGAFGAGIYVAGRPGYRWLRRRLAR